jgi:hypothetical protein
MPRKDSIPPLEGVLPETDDDILQDLLYVMCFWYTLAKSQMHTTSTVEIFDAATAALGIHVRRFAHDLCKRYENTTETPRESAKRVRNAQARAKKANVPCTVDGSARPKPFNLDTVKMQSLGDYPAHVKEFGVIPGFDSSTVSYAFSR